MVIKNNPKALKLSLGVLYFHLLYFAQNTICFHTIKNGQIWIDMLETRNCTSHEYDMDKVDRMLENVAYKYFDELTLFVEKIKDFHD